MNEPDRRWSPGPATELDLREMAEKAAGEPDTTLSMACRGKLSCRNCRRRDCACLCHSEQVEAGEGPSPWSMNDVLDAFGRPPVEGGDGR